MAILTLEGVTKVYGTGHTAVKAVDRVDLEVDPGEIVLIQGPSGSGKTTLLSMAGALLRPTEGRVNINGHEVSSMREAELPPVRLREIGFVFQAFNLLSNLTALENVLVPLILNRRPSRPGQKGAAELLAELGLSHRLDHVPADLSGGEQQRVAIARALANDPKLILADEPTGNLDSRTGQEVTRLLCQIACERQVSVVIVSHDQRIADVAHRVVWMEDGRLKYEPTPKAPTPYRVGAASDPDRSIDIPRTWLDRIKGRGNGLAGPEITTVLLVRGMSCSHCAQNVRDTLLSLEGVVGVEVQLDPGLVEVRHDPIRADGRALVHAVLRAGGNGVRRYSAHVVE